jgi:hypothetical protein
MLPNIFNTKYLSVVELSGRVTEPAGAPDADTLAIGGGTELIGEPDGCRDVGIGLKSRIALEMFQSEGDVRLLNIESGDERENGHDREKILHHCWSPYPPLNYSSPFISPPWTIFLSLVLPLEKRGVGNTLNGQRMLPDDSGGV